VNLVIRTVYSTTSLLSRSLPHTVKEERTAHRAQSRVYANCHNKPRLRTRNTQHVIHQPGSKSLVSSVVRYPRYLDTYRRGHDIPRYIVAVENTVKRHKYRAYRRESATHCTVFYNLYPPVLGQFYTGPSLVL